MRVVLLIVMIINLIIMLCLLIATMTDIKEKSELVKGIDYLKAYNKEQEQQLCRLYNDRFSDIDDKIIELSNKLYSKNINSHVSIDHPERWTTKTVESGINITD